MASRRELVVALISDSSQFSRGFDQAKRDVQGYGKTVESVGKKQVGGFNQSITGLRTSLGGLAAGLAGFASISFLKSAVADAEEANSVFKTTQQIIESTGGSANVSADHVKEYADELAVLTGIDDEVVLGGENVLLTFKNVRNELGEGNDVFDRAAGLMLDISAVMGTDAKSAALQLGKALNDPVGQMGALSRAGLTFTQTQKDQIKELVANNDLLGAQTMILDELESQLGGTAAAAATATDKMAVAFDEVSEAVGQALLPMIEDTLPTVIDLADRLGQGLAIVGASTVFEKIALQTGAAEGGSKNLAIALSQVAVEMEKVNAKAEGGAGSKGVTGMADQFRAIIEASGAGVDALSELRNSLDVLVAQGFIEAGTQAEVLASILEEELVTAQFSARDAARHHKEAVEELPPVIEPFNEAVGRSGDKAKFAADELSRAASETRNLRSAFLEAADPVYAAVAATDRVREAEEHLREVRKDNESTARDIALAELAVSEAKVEAQAALDSLDPATLEAAISTIATSLGKTREETEELLVQLGILDGKKVAVQIDINVTQHGTASGGGAGGLLEGLAAGGRASAGTPYVVGENGPELFVPSTSGNVMPAGSFTTGGSSSMTINVGEVTDRALQDIQSNLILASVGRWAENH